MGRSGGDNHDTCRYGSRKRRWNGRSAAAYSASSVGSRAVWNGERTGPIGLTDATPTSFRPTRPHLLSRRYGAAETSHTEIDPKYSAWSGRHLHESFSHRPPQCVGMVAVRVGDRGIDCGGSSHCGLVREQPW